MQEAPQAPAVREVSGPARLGRRTKHLVKRLRPGDVAVIDHRDLDRVSAEDLIAVGEQLRDLGEGRQVVCITHLPQIAALAARHFSIRKDTSVEPAVTTVQELAQREVVAELVRMLGADAGDVAARRHAKELLKAA